MTASYMEFLDSVVSYLYLSASFSLQESKRTRCLKVSLWFSEIASTKFSKRLAGCLRSGTSMTKVSSPSKLLIKEDYALKSSVLEGS